MSSAGTERPTLASTWLAISGAAFTDELLAWPPDVFALTNVLLDRSEAFRFALSPPEGVRWPPSVEWSDAVVDAGREWSAWVEDREGSVPSLLAEEWSVALGCADLPLADLAEGRDWRLCAALLSLHAIADEACAGVGSATERADGRGAVYRARARELLARTGSLARIARGACACCRRSGTPPTGRPAFSRYACVQGAGLEASWHKLPTRHPGTDPWAEYVNLLLLPWPLRVRESDFRPVEGSVQRLEREIPSCDQPSSSTAPARRSRPCANRGRRYAGPTGVPTSDVSEPNPPTSAPAKAPFSEGVSAPLTRGSR